MSGYGCPWDFPADLFFLHNSHGGEGFPADRISEVNRLFAQHDENQKRFSKRLAEIAEEKTKTQ